jgi:hypothetical protein
MEFSHSDKKIPDLEFLVPCCNMHRSWSTQRALGFKSQIRGRVVTSRLKAFTKNGFTFNLLTFHWAMGKYWQLIPAP